MNALFLLLGALACTCRPQPGAQVEDHYVRVNALRGALTDGDFEQAREEARRLDGGAIVELLGPTGEEAEAELHLAVGFLLSSQDLAESAEGLAAVGASCGSCHARVGARLRPQAPELPADLPLGEPLPGATHPLLERALWEALRCGQPELAAGAVTLLSRHPLASGPETGARILETASSTSLVAGDLEGLYAELLASCSGCHAR